MFLSRSFITFLTINRCLTHLGDTFTGIATWQHRSKQSAT